MLEHKSSSMDLSSRLSILAISYTDNFASNSFCLSMPVSFGTLPPEIRLTIYRHLFDDKKIYYLGARRPNHCLPDLEMPAMLVVSKLHRAEVLETLTSSVPVHISQVAQFRPICKSPIKNRVRSIRMDMTHYQYKADGMELVLAKMSGLSEVTICGFLRRRFASDKDLSFFKEDLKLAHENPSLLEWLCQMRRRDHEDPRGSIVKAFTHEPWSQHLLRGHSRLHQRPQIKLFAEVKWRLWNLSEHEAFEDALYGAPQRLSYHQLQAWEQTWGNGPANDPYFVNVLGRMCLDDWLMHWELNGKPFSKPLLQERFPDADA